MSSQMTVKHLKGLSQNRKLYTNCTFITHRIAWFTRSQLILLFKLKITLKVIFNQDGYMQSPHHLSRSQIVMR